MGFEGAVGTRRETRIHETAIVDPLAEVGEGVEVGPWAIIGPRVRVGDGTTVGPRVLIERDTEIGEDCRLANGAVLGTDPQDLKYKGEPTVLRVGDRTVVGSDCLLMAYAHVAHDCEIGHHVVIANSVNMAGHVVIEDWAIVGGVTPIHQHVRIGAHAFVGGGSRIPQDIPPYCRAAGNPPKLYGLNSVGLERRGFSEEVRSALKQAYRLLFQGSENLSRALERAEVEVPGIPEVKHLLAFIRASERGITT